MHSTDSETWPKSWGKRCRLLSASGAKQTETRDEMERIHKGRIRICQMKCMPQLKESHSLPRSLPCSPDLPPKAFASASERSEEFCENAFRRHTTAHCKRPVRRGHSARRQKRAKKLESQQTYQVRTSITKSLTRL